MDQQRDGDRVLHQQAHEEVIEETVDEVVDDHIEEHNIAGSDVAVLADLPAFTDPPSAAEMTALRTSHNKILEALRDVKIIPTA